MTVSTFHLDLPLLLTAISIAISLLGLVVSVVQNRRQIRRAIAEIRLTDDGLTVKTPDLRVIVDRLTERPARESEVGIHQLEDVELQAERQIELQAELEDELQAELLADLDELLHAHTRLERVTIAQLRCPSRSDLMFRSFVYRDFP